MVFEKVVSIISDILNVDASKITKESRLVEDLHADSLDAVEIIANLEDEFQLTVSDDQAQTIKTVGDLVDCIEAASK